MGKHFGNLQRLYGVVYYTLSPHELKPFAGFFNPGVKNFCRRMVYSGSPFVLMSTIGYLIYHRVTEIHTDSLRKKPEMFQDEV